MNKKTFISANNLLGISFVILKLCNVINWSWIWVLSPFWSEFIFRLFLILFVEGLNRSDNTKKHRKKIIDINVDVKKI